jgi:hypothetical protein
MVSIRYRAIACSKPHPDSTGRIILDVAPPQQTDVTVPRDPPYSDLSAQFNDLSLDSGASYAATDAYSHGQGQDHSGYAQATEQVVSSRHGHHGHGGDVKHGNKHPDKKHGGYKHHDSTHHSGKHDKKYQKTFDNKHSGSKRSDSKYHEQEEPKGKGKARATNDYPAGYPDGGTGTTSAYPPNTGNYNYGPLTSGTSDYATGASWTNYPQDDEDAMMQQALVASANSYYADQMPGGPSNSQPQDYTEAYQSYGNSMYWRLDLVTGTE